MSAIEYSAEMRQHMETHHGLKSLAPAAGTVEAEVGMWELCENYLGQCVVARKEDGRIFLATHTLDGQVVLACRALVDAHNASLRDKP